MISSPKITQALLADTVNALSLPLEMLALGVVFQVEAMMELVDRNDSYRRAMRCELMRATRSHIRVRPQPAGPLTFGRSSVVANQPRRADH